MAPRKNLLRVFRKYKYGVALSGGGVRAYAHLGALKALNEAGIYPEAIAGVSAGALVGAFYADGYKPDEIVEILSENNFFRFFNLTFPKQGLLKITGLEKTLIENLNARKIEDLKMPFYIGATELNSGILRYFSEGKLIRTLIASACIPILFIPVEIDGKTYVDGGVMENLPVTPLQILCRKIIGIHVNPNKEQNNFNNLLRIAERVFSIHAYREVSRNRKKCNIFIEPPGLESYSILDVSKGKEIYNLGYDYTKIMLEKLPPLQRIPNMPA